MNKIFKKKKLDREIEISQLCFYVISNSNLKQQTQMKRFKSNPIGLSNSNGFSCFVYLCLHRYRDLIGLRCLVQLLIWLRSKHGRLYGCPTARTYRLSDPSRSHNRGCGRERTRRLIANAWASRSLRLLTQNWRRMG